MRGPRQRYPFQITRAATTIYLVPEHPTKPLFDAPVCVIVPAH
jgi:hypothetical protein